MAVIYLDALNMTLNFGYVHTTSLTDTATTWKLFLDKCGYLSSTFLHSWKLTNLADPNYTHPNWIWRKT